MTRDICMVGWTGTGTVGKRGWLSTTWMRILATRPLVVRSLNMCGDIHVRLLSETAIETQIKFSDDDEWQPPVVLTLQHRDGSSERNWSVPLSELGAGAATGWRHCSCWLRRDVLLRAGVVLGIK